MIKPDTSVLGGYFNIGLGKSRFENSVPVGMGGRLWVNDELIVDAWVSGSNVTSRPFDFVARKPLSIKFEYFQTSTEGNPSVALRWSLLPSDPEIDPIADAVTEIEALGASEPGHSAVVLALGGANNDGDATTEGEGKDRATLSLPGRQLELVKRAFNASVAARVPLVVVLVDGRPTAEPFLAKLPAVVAAFQGGQAQGLGLASILTGDYNPSGKLPVTFPTSAAALPVYYNHKPSASRKGWIDDPTTPGGDGILWGFGHGKSYTSFNYSNIVVPTDFVPASGEVRISVTVTNTGDRDGTEVAQLYIRDMVSSITTPVKSLKV